jgi:hypothetical protein
MPDQTARIEWPHGFERTPADDRDPYPGDLSPTRKTSFESVVDELERWGATEGSVEIDTASQHYVDRPNIPHQHDKPDDPGVVARFRRVDEPSDDGFAIACDRWETQRENARAIALYARRMRLAERCGVATATSTFETARLPPADEENDVVVAGSARKEPHEVLGVAPDAPDAVVTGAYRELLKERHPDHGGTAAALKALNRAKDVMLDD